MAQCVFGFALYAPIDGLRHHHDGPPALHDQSAVTCHPCYSGGLYGTLPFSLPIFFGLLLL